MNRLDGKVAPISGAAVVIGDVLDAAKEQTAAAIRAAGGRADHLRLDVTPEEDWVAAVALATGRHGRLDLLVNNAGVFIGKGIEEISLEEWQRLVAVNMTVVFLGTRAAAPALREAGQSSAQGSAMVNLASIAGLVLDGGFTAA